MSRITIKPRLPQLEIRTRFWIKRRHAICLNVKKNARDCNSRLGFFFTFEWFRIGANFLGPWQGSVKENHFNFSLVWLSAEIAVKYTKGGTKFALFDQYWCTCVVMAGTNPTASLKEMKYKYKSCSFIHTSEKCFSLLPDMKSAQV